MIAALEHKTSITDRAKDFDLYGKATSLGLVLSHWQSDLYVQASPEAYELVKLYQEVTGFAVLSFVSKTDNRLWYEAPFQYSPYWDTALRNIRGTHEERVPE